MQQSLFRGKAFSFPGVCELCSVCQRKFTPSVTFEDILSRFFVTFDDITKIVTFEDLSDLHRLHLCACPICSRSDFQRVRFFTAVVWDAFNILTPSLWNHFEHAEIHFKVWMKEIQILQIKMLSNYFFARWSVLMHHRHIKQMARPVLYTLSMLCGVYCIVWFYIHFPYCVVYSVILYTLSILCSV